jgi:glycosyltransferase involved in cell wall biosynthesis
MALTIVNVAFPFAAVGPFSVGGAEQVVSALESAVAAAGDHSIVVAAFGSRVRGELWELPPTKHGLLTQDACDRIHQAQRRVINRILERRPVDLIHMHGIDFFNCLPDLPVPILVTLHLPLSWYPNEIFSLRRPHTYFVCVSNDQYRSIRAGAFLPPIENGVQVKALSDRRKYNFVASLGRICPEKGFHFALNAARRARMPLLLAGKVFFYPEHVRYFAEEIIPRLDRMRRFVGPLGGLGKRRLLTSALCLLVPSIAEETSSLVAMEALACGTPVIAFRSGALAEIVEHGETGFLVDDEIEMAEAIDAARGLDPEACRESARRRFSLKRMTESYLRLYRWLASNNTDCARPEIVDPPAA